jgi:hypothetical protein
LVSIVTDPRIPTVTDQRVSIVTDPKKRKRERAKRSSQDYKKKRLSYFGARERGDEKAIKTGKSAR